MKQKIDLSFNSNRQKLWFDGRKMEEAFAEELKQMKNMIKMGGWCVQWLTFEDIFVSFSDSNRKLLLLDYQQTNARVKEMVAAR